MKIRVIYYFAFIFILSISCIRAQVSSQTDTGSVASGVVLSVGNFSNSNIIHEQEKRVIRNEPQAEEQTVFIQNMNSPAAGSNYYTDSNVGNSPQGTTGQPVMLNSFAGIPMTNSIPPDPDVAAGPNHIIATVNSRFKIWDKQGNELKNIDANTFFTPTLGSPNVFDPQVVYDHYDNRWIMVWDNENSNTQTAYFFIAVSDDDNPLGTWYSWAIPAHLNGSQNSFTWGDYEHIGYDQQALYISSNQFGFNSGYQYVKIRIIPKSELYANTAGSLSWRDIWNITDPNGSGRPRTIMPTVTYGNMTDYYFINSGNSGNALILYKITDPLGSATLTGSFVPVTTYYNSPNANQLGGGSLSIESGGSPFKNRGIVRNDTLWNVHPVANPASYTYSAISYYAIDVTSSTALADMTWGAVGYWYLYPQLAVDTKGDIGITYSRSSDSTYIGAYYTSRLISDPPGFSGSHEIKPGAGNYVVDYGSGRNRWGDYFGAAVDPSDLDNFWFFTEYASATNTWNTWVSEVRVTPYSGAHIYPENSFLNFSDVEVNHTDTLSIIISNYGDLTLNITAIPDSTGPFHFVPTITFPYNLVSYDSVTLYFTFSPTVVDTFDLYYPVTSNDANFPGIRCFGHAYKINLAQDNVLYGSTGAGNNGQMITIDKSSGNGTDIGFSRFDEVKSISVDPNSKKIYGLITNSQQSSILRVNASGGDSYTLFSFDVANMAGLAFDTTGTLFASSKVGKIYKIDLINQTYSLFVDAGATVSGIAFNPISNELWASSYFAVGPNRDLIFKINMTTGDTTILGHTGLSVMTNDIIFDQWGNLYGVTGAYNQANDFISIDTSTAAGTVIGSTGINNITGLTYLPNSAAGVPNGNKNNIPHSFSLSQNYPNPFNPSTTIEYNLPVNSNVKINIYNLLGELVNVLINKNENAGVHRIVWNSRSNNGKTVSSGIYFYELKAQGVNGKSFTQVRKMILLK